MLESSGTREECIEILRHETGHAIENAYRLRRRRRPPELFGSTSRAVPDRTRAAVQQELRRLPRREVRAEPSGRGLRGDVRGLARPESRLGDRYQGWQALKRSSSTSTADGELVGRQPPVTSTAEPAPPRRSTRRSRAHYEERRATTASTGPASTTATCAGSSPARRSTPAASAAGSSSAIAARCASSRAAGRTSTSTRSTASSPT